MVPGDGARGEGGKKGWRRQGEPFLPNGRRTEGAVIERQGGREVLSVNRPQGGILEGGATFAPRYKEPRRGIKRWKKKEPGESG